MKPATQLGKLHEYISSDAFLMAIRIRAFTLKLELRLQLTRLRSMHLSFSLAHFESAADAAGCVAAAVRAWQHGC